MKNNCGDVQKSFVKSGDNQVSSKSIKGVSITQLAADKIKFFLQNDNKSHKTHCLAVSVNKDGCSGMSYKMDMSEISACEALGHKRFERDGSVLMIAKTSYLFVIGSELNYTEALTGSGFVLINPNAKKFCSCGASFGV
eukprot:COSAG01_NODE_14_length_41020_cov_40.702133_7_plen_139_part_00